MAIEIQAMGDNYQAESSAPQGIVEQVDATQTQLPQGQDWQSQAYRNGEGDAQGNFKAPNPQDLIKQGMDNKDAVDTQSEDPDQTQAEAMSDEELEAMNEVPREEMAFFGDDTDVIVNEDGNYEGEFNFMGEEIALEMPDLDAQTLSGIQAAGLTVEGIAQEMFHNTKSNGDGMPDQATIDKLKEHLNPFMVDAFFQNQLKTNEIRMQEWQREAEGAEQQVYQQTQADLDLFDNCTSMIGGEEEWAKLEQYSLEHMSDDELEQFNDIMLNGTPQIQKMAVEHLHHKMTINGGAMAGAAVEAGSPRAASNQQQQGGGIFGQSQDVNMQPLGRDEYQQEVARVSKEHRTNPSAYKQAMAELDARRRQGMQIGI